MSDFDREKDEIERALALSRVERPAYSHLYDFLEALFIARAEAKDELRLEVPSITASAANTRWENGFPLLNRWDFPIDLEAAEHLLKKIGDAAPGGNRQLADAYQLLSNALATHHEQREEFWKSFLQHEMEPWEEWLKIGSAPADLASVLFLARSAIRPSIEYTAQRLLDTHPIPESWLKGYCPVCGSLPSLLYLEGEGTRKSFCSWCGTRWSLHRLQCPCCENRLHDSLGYISIEAEQHNRIVYCNLCKSYFKQIDIRELAYAPYLPLEEWATLHLDLLAQKNGFNQAPSPSPAIYGKAD
ncbi:MAG: formate dehydrogenase accessory protein FdhE [Syntrophobacteraceae bacterium]